MLIAYSPCVTYWLLGVEIARSVMATSSLVHSVQDASEAKLASCSMGTKGYFPTYKATGA
jgi:hypothetical protein